MTQQNPYALQNGSHSASLFRAASYSPFLAGGIVAPSEYAVSAQSTPNMSVQVAGGRAWIPGTQVSNVSGQGFSTQAGYFALNDAPATVTIATANATNPRIDTVYVAVNDSFYSGTNNNAVIGVVTGTPASSPVAPAAPSNSLTLATVAVAANATSITNSNISNGTTASLLTVARGGFDPVLSTARPTTGLYAGYPIYETDTGRRYTYSGTAWQYAGGNPPPIVAVTLQGGWTAYPGAAPGVYKDASGLVHFVGGVVNSSSYNPNSAAASVCQLPSGYYDPNLTQAVMFSLNAGGVVIYGQITSGGMLQVTASPSTSVAASTGHRLELIAPLHLTYAGAVPLS